MFSIPNVLWNNRGKLAIAAAIAISSAVILHYTTLSPQVPPSLSEQESEQSNPSAVKKAMTPSLRSKLLIKARKQFETASKQFLTTLRHKIIEEVDVISAVRQIKEVRASGSSDSKEAEARLWEDIKIGSFTLLYVTIYMSSVLSVLLKVQMHQLAKHSHTSSHDGINHNWENDSELFRTLIEISYKNLFGAGLVKLVSLIRDSLTEEMTEWTVRDKLSISYNETLQLMSNIRNKIEFDV